MPDPKDTRSNPDSFCCNCKKSEVERIKIWAANHFNVPIESIYVGKPYPEYHAPVLVGIWIK